MSLQVNGTGAELVAAHDSTPEVCTANPAPRLAPGSIGEQLTQVRTEIDRKRKAEAAVRKSRNWNPDAVIKREQSDLLNEIEIELDRVQDMLPKAIRTKGIQPLTAVARDFAALRTEITRRRKEAGDRRASRNWDPDKVLKRPQTELLDHIENELDRICTHPEAEIPMEQQGGLTARRQSGILISTVNHTAKENRMKAKATKQPATPETVKTTLRLPVELWDRIQHRAIDEKLSLQQIAERALEAYLKAGKK
jgi:hypothetical protein